LELQDAECGERSYWNESDESSFHHYTTLPARQPPWTNAPDGVHVGRLTIAGSVLTRLLRAHTSISAPIKLRLFTELAAVEPQWREFQETADYTVFQSFDWLMEWYTHIGANRKLTPVIIFGSVDGDPCLLLPLAIDSSIVRRLVWLGVDLADYNAPLLSPNFQNHVPQGQFAPVWNAIVSMIKSRLHFDCIELDKMPSLIGEKPNPFSELPVSVAECSAHAAHLPSGWEPFYRWKVSSVRRQADRRKLRRLSEMGEVRFVEVDEPSDIENTFTALFEQKRASYARMGVADLLAPPGHQEFYRAIALNPHLHSIVHVSRLDIGADPAATGLALRFKSRYHTILHSYQEKYAKYSPGGHHIQHLIKYAIDQGFRIFDFTIGNELYKKTWCDVEMPLLRYYGSETVRGYIAIVFLRLRNQAIRWYVWYKNTRP
jgi:CelD/BcsL family acetyltransferase involved in cellulose biosynthesis